MTMWKFINEIRYTADAGESWIIVIKKYVIFVKKIHKLRAAYLYIDKPRFQKFSLILLRS